MESEQVLLHNSENGDMTRGSVAADTAASGSNNDKNQCQPSDGGDQRSAVASTARLGAAALTTTGGKSCETATAAEPLAATNDDPTLARTLACGSHASTKTEHHNGTTTTTTTMDSGCPLCDANDPLVAKEQARPSAHGHADRRAAPTQTRDDADSDLGRSASHVETTKRTSWPALMGLAVLVALVGLVSGQPVGLLHANAAHLATSYRDEAAPYLDASCESRRREAAGSEAARLLLLLKCDLKPLYEQYVAAFGKEAAKSVGGKPRIGRDLARIAEAVDEFADEGFTLLGAKDFCTYHTVSRLSKLKGKAAESNLLSIAYDTIAIEFHRSCLGEIIRKLPPVPPLVRDVVKMYIEGVDKKLVRPKKGRGLNSANDYDDQPFDVDVAIRHNGKLEHVVGLLLTMPLGEIKSDEEIADDFRHQCKKFLIEIEQRWDTGEMMSSMLTTEGNAIKSVNNYVMRTLAPTKFADICTQLSSRA